MCRCSLRSGCICKLDVCVDVDVHVCDVVDVGVFVGAGVGVA